MMKRMLPPVLAIASIIAALLLWPAATPAAENGEVEWLNYSEAVSRGAAEDKIILVDVYTDWCGWCRKMDREVYGDAAVREYLAAHYVAAKLDAESGARHTVQGQEATESQIAKAYGISGYPATIFLNAEGEIITILSGYVDRDRFLLVLEYIHEGIYETQGWEDFLSSRGK
ncbi:MAG: DUF255 domain-containing protein [Bacteroidota bacterium]|nr:DUF255 domain-containing protein [Bacteroidota bacterium]